MWVRVGALAPRLALSVGRGTGLPLLLRCGEAKRRDRLARSFQGVSHASQWSSVNLEDKSSLNIKTRFEPKRYITCPKLAKRMAELVQKYTTPCPVILECSPGPGVLTQELVNIGNKVVALESDIAFIPELKSLQNKWNGLEVIFCDFFKLDPVSGGLVKPPIMVTETLFQHLGIEPVSWKADVPLKVVGLLPDKNEKKVLWKLLHDIYSCTSVFKYGRVELNLFISQQEYQKLVANPKCSNLYQPLSVLWQVACDIKLLHTESCESFDISRPNGKLVQQKMKVKPAFEKMCFIQLTPRKDLFTENLSPINYDIFCHMIKQCFVRRAGKLSDHLASLSPIDMVDILQHIHELNRSKIIDLYPHEFKRLFEVIECCKDYTHKWLFNDYLEEVTL